MGVFIFQGTILAILTFSGLFGRKSVIAIAVLISFFTLVEVFMPWLMVIQFATVLLGANWGMKLARAVYGNE